MAISRTPEIIRSRVPERKARRAARWVLIFCLGFYLGTIAVELSPVHCDVEDRK